MVLRNLSLLLVLLGLVSALLSSTAGATTPNHSLQLHTCTALMLDGEGARALRQAPPHIKEGIRRNWKSVLSGLNRGWTYPAIEVLMALDQDTTELRSFLTEVIRDFLQKTPRRQNAGLLTDNQWLMLPGPPSGIELLTDFPGKYDLKSYAQISEKIFSQVLPAEYAKSGMWLGDSAHKFGAFALAAMFRGAFDLGLIDEQGALLRVMLIHQKFHDLGDAIELLDDDDLFYRVGLYALSQFYFHHANPYYDNKLWSAVDLMKRTRRPEMRERMRKTFIDLAQDIISVEFQQKILVKNNANQTKADAEMGPLLDNVLRALKSSGEVLHIEAEWGDPNKVSFTTRSQDPQLRAMIRKVVSLQDKLLSDKMDKQIEAFQVTDDRESIEHKLATARARNSKYLELKALAALGDMNQLAEAYLHLPAQCLADHFLEGISETAHVAGLDVTLPAEIQRRGGNPGPYLRAARNTAMRRLPREARMKMGSDFPNHRFRYHLAQERSLKLKSALATAAGYERQRDDLNAGGWYLKAAFAFYLNSQSEEAGLFPVGHK